MKLIGLFLFLLTMDDVAAGPNESNPSMLRRTQTSKSRRPSKMPCVVVITHKQYADHHSEEQPLECELQSDDIVGTNKIKMVKVKGLNTAWARKNKIESGVTTLFAPKSVIDDDSNELIIPTGETIKLGRRNRNHNNSGSTSGLGSSWDPSDFNWNRNLQTSIKKVLVLRIQGADTATTASESQLADDVFGAAGDPSNLKSQTNQCSYGQLQFEPSTSNASVGPDGVYTVTLPTTTVTGASDFDIAWAAVNKASAELGTLTSIANHVMVCVPPGTSGGWIAWAYVNHWMSVYNNAWCGYLSAQMHEVGHNLNLAHSGESGEYDDQSGMMGYSYSNDDGPNMCYNGPKTWQLGWFSDYHVNLSSANGFSWTGDLVGFAQKANAAPADKMIIRIQGASDTYINFNRQIGMNSGTQEGGNQVLVTTRATGTGYAPSTLVAKLSANGVYTIPNFSGTSSLRITVNSIVTSTTPGRANLSIALVAAPTGAPTASPTRSPTAAPTGAPTQSPTQAPTGSPTQSPTQAPTGAPTQSPTQTPTGAPTQSPTQTPTGTPTQSPTQTPTGAPTHAPTQAPTEAPTQSPVTQAPTEAPTQSPTQTPTGAPTQSPTQTPTEAPTQSPTQAPTEAPTQAPVTQAPTEAPTQAPVTQAPTEPPTQSPTETPTGAPTQSPTQEPTEAPTQSPTGAPTGAPTQSPTQEPTAPPTQSPTGAPTGAPTQSPTTRAPTVGPTTRTPTSKPTTRSPTARPTRAPTARPTTRTPTARPTTRTPTLRPSTAKPV